MPIKYLFEGFMQKSEFLCKITFDLSCPYLISDPCEKRLLLVEWLTIGSKQFESPHSHCELAEAYQYIAARGPRGENAPKMFMLKDNLKKINIILTRTRIWKEIILFIRLLTMASFKPKSPILWYCVRLTAIFHTSESAARGGRPSLEKPLWINLLVLSALW